MFVEYFCKFSKAMALDNQRAETVGRELVEQFVMRHGVPSQLLTDRLSSLFLNSWGITLFLRPSKASITPYHPAWNGAVKMLNQTVI